MSFISLDRDNNRLFFDKLFVHLSKLDPEISPFFYNGGRPLLSILNPFNPEDAWRHIFWVF